MLDANIYNLYKAGISLADIEMNHEPSEEEKMIRSESGAGFIPRLQDYVKIKDILLFMKMI